MATRAALYYQAHRKRIRARQKAYYRTHKARFARRMKLWRRRNREWTVAYLKRTAKSRRSVALDWAAANRKHLAKYQAAYRRKHPVRVARYEAKRIRTKAQRRQFNLYHKTWRDANRSKRQLYYQARRARIARTRARLTLVQLERQRTKQVGRCFYCRRRLDNKGLGHIEHKTPLVRGGTHSARNIVIACAGCNMRKGRLTAPEFLRLIRGPQSPRL